VDSNLIGILYYYTTFLSEFYVFGKIDTFRFRIQNQNWSSSTGFKTADRQDKMT